MSTTKTGADDQTAEAALAFGDLKPEHVVKFLSHRNAKPQCLQCDANDWEITDSDRDGAAYVALQPGGYDSKVTSHVPVMLMVCRNCSNTRLLAALPIVEWLRGEGRNA